MDKVVISEELLNEIVSLLSQLPYAAVVDTFERMSAEISAQQQPNLIVEK